MKYKSAATAFGKAAFRRLGLDVRRSPSRKPIQPLPLQPPPICEDPLEALHLRRGGAKAAFLCPPNLLRTPDAFSLGTNGWHPLASVIFDMDKNPDICYSRSTLQNYFHTFQPKNASQAIAGFKARCSLAGLPSYMYYLQPWVSHSPKVLEKMIRSWFHADAREHGVNSPITLERDGLGRHGPVSDVIGQLEFQRMVKISKSLKERGYDRTLGDAQCKILRRGSEICFLQQGVGYHRTVAAATLGVSVPAQFTPNHADLVDVADAEWWPQVRTGIWNPEEAVAYFHHVFDFDSTAWAERRGIVPR